MKQLLARRMFPVGLLLIGLCIVFIGYDGQGLYAHEDAAPHQNHPPLHAVDTMRAFQSDSIEVQQLAAMAGAEIPCVNGFAGEYPCSNVDLLSFLPLSEIGGGEGNDIWGWTDPSNGREYAIMGRTGGTSFVDITDPINPVYLGNLPTNSTFGSSWRDIKVYADHAFIVSEANRSGLQVFDLTQLGNVNNPPVTFSSTATFRGFRSAHNVVINEDSGYAYAVGTNDCSGGLHMVDIQNPSRPSDAGCYTVDGYTHDAQCVIYNGPDTDHSGREICFAYNEDTLTIVDVTDKNNPFMISRTGYIGHEYTHQGWLTDDQAYLLMNDELDERNHLVNTSTYIWDVRDLDAPINTDVFVNMTSNIDHNLYIKGDYVYQANYRAGLRILDISEVANANLSEVAYFDIYPADNAAQFNGAWSTYPFFESGTVIVSGIEQGLYVLRPNLGTTPPGDAAPTANIVSPTNGATIVGSQLIQIDANDAEDATGSLTVTWNLNGGADQPTSYNSSSGYYEATWDSTLNGDGGYTLNVTAIDSMNQGGSDSVNVTVDNVADPTMHVGDLDGSAVVDGRGGKWSATVTVTVHDSSENPVSNATVNGSFGSCVTDGSGECSMTRSNINRNSSSVTFTMDSITHSSNVYNSADNHDPDGDSNGTDITVLKP